MSSLHLTVDFTFQQLVEVVKQLSPEEKLQLNEVIWLDNINIPSEHQAIVRERMADYASHPNRLVDWDEASTSI